MITKDLNFKNKYIVTDPFKPEDLKPVLQPFIRDFKCFICNRDMCKKLNIRPGGSLVTIDNSVEDGVFFINGKY